MIYTGTYIEAVIQTSLIQSAYFTKLLKTDPKIK
jgi:hypothetical protein